MNVDLGAAIAVGSIIFAAGGAWITLARTEKRGRVQGERIGKLAGRVKFIEGVLSVRRQPTRPQGVPVSVDPDATDE